MSILENILPATIIPTMRYRNPSAAIDWLCQAFDFKKHLIIPGKNGQIIHAELTYGNGMIMIGVTRDDEFSKLLKQPEDCGNSATQSAYIIVNDADAHYAQAKASAAEIVMDIQDEGYGGRGYSCRDLEGHLWNFGTYNPWRGFPA